MADVAHVVVLMLENRSFDHLLGYLNHPDQAFDGLRGNGEFTNPGWAGAPKVAASPDAKMVLPVGPDHSHNAVMEQLALTAAGQPTNQGFVISYERKGRGLDPPVFGGLVGSVLNWVRDDVAEPEFRACGDLRRGDRDRDPSLHQPDDLRAARGARCGVADISR